MKTSQVEQFRNLHHTEQLFVLPNVWNAKSALVMQQQFSAVGTSSAAVAESLGYNDGEVMSFGEYLDVIRHIASAVRIPVTVDLETGYGKSNLEIYANIESLVALGVAGINIEDSIITSAGRVLKDAKTFAETILFIKERLRSDQADIFMNVRCDTYLLEVNDKQAETAERINSYEIAGADGIFLPFIRDESDIAAAVDQTKLPLNVMCIDGLPGFDVLNKLGVKRASMGPFMFAKVYDYIRSLSRSVIENNDFSILVS